MKSRIEHLSPDGSGAIFALHGYGPNFKLRSRRPWAAVLPLGGYSTSKPSQRLLTNSAGRVQTFASKSAALHALHRINPRERRG